MATSLTAAAEAFREAIRETVKRYALWYLIEGVLLVGAGILAIIYPAIASTAVVVLLGWLLIISGILQGLSLIGARYVPHFWLQLISVILAVLVGLLFLRDPAQGMLTIALLLIVFFMIEGISKVHQAGGPISPMQIRALRMALTTASSLTGRLKRGARDAIEGDRRRHLRHQIPVGDAHQLVHARRSARLFGLQPWVGHDPCARCRDGREPRQN